MKKSSLTTAVLAGIVGVAGFAGTASAVQQVPYGVGQVLIYPYYTTRGNQQTLVSVVNTSDSVKAVKVRMLESYNSTEVLDFNLFLSPWDVWTASIGELSSGLPGIATNDNSCTVPAIDPAGQEFLTYGYTGTGADGGPTGIDRAREGYIEMIEMATVVGATATAVTHTASGAPANCSPTGIDDPANTDYVAPGDADTTPGGLFGNGAIISVPEGIMYGYEADTLAGFNRANLFSGAGDPQPNLMSVNDDSFQATATAHVFMNNGDVITAVYPGADPNSRRVDAVSAVFAATSVMNEWVANSAGGIGSDWVLTFPTKRFYVWTPATPPIAPFASAFAAPGQSCDEVKSTIFNREELTKETKDEPIFSPPPPEGDPTGLCHEVNVITFGGQDSILHSDPDTVLKLPAFGTETEGWFKLTFANTPMLLASDAAGPDGAVVFGGLPVTGFWADKFIRGTGGSVLGNYSGAFHHRFEREVIS